MKKRAFFLLAFTLSVMLLQAQCTEFTVFHTKGEVKLLKGADATPARKNMKLEGDVRLSIGQDANLILLCSKDKALRMGTPGTLTMAEIRATCLKNKSSLTKEYINYVAQSIIDKGEPKTAMVIKGAVYRTRNNFEPTAMIAPADSSTVSTNPVTFTWRLGTPGVPKYLLIYENGVREICSKMLADTTFSLDASLFKPEVIYFWLVSASSTPSDKEPRFTFIYGEPGWEDKFLEDWSATLEELENDTDALMQRMKEKKQKP
jgi:hypothetical protein